MKFLVYGTDSYRARRFLAEQRARFVSMRDPSGLNVQVLRADAQPEEVEAALFAAPFLAEKRLVIVDGVIAAWAEEMQEQAVATLARLPETTISIFFESAEAADMKGMPLFEALKSEKYTQEFAALDPAGAIRFVAEIAGAAGVELSSNVASRLVTSAGVESSRLKSETEKICAYVLGSGRKSVTSDDVADLVVGTSDEPVFAFLDACAAGQGPTALGKLEKLLSAGLAEQQLIAMLLNQFKLLVAAADYRERGGRSADEFARLMGAKPFSAQKALSASARFPTGELKDRYLELVDIDRDSKSGGWPKVRLAAWAVKLGLPC